MHKNRNLIIEKNFNYVSNKIINGNSKLLYKDIFDDLLNNKFIQTVDYSFDNNNRELIKKKTESKDRTNDIKDKNKDKKIDSYFKDNNNNDNNNDNNKSKNLVSTNNNESNITLFSNFVQYNLDVELNNNLCAAVLFTLSDIFRVLNLKEKKAYIKSLKYKMYLELSEKKLYYKFNYNKKRLKKSDLESQLMKFELLNITGKKYLIDYFNINIILYDLNNKKYLSYLQFDETKKNILIGVRITDFKKIIYFPLINDDYDFIEPCNISKLIEQEKLDIENIFIPLTKLKGISSYKLLDLQQKCKDLQIDLFKIVDGKEKKKTKKDLYSDLSIIYNK